MIMDALNACRQIGMTSCRTRLASGECMLHLQAFPDLAHKNYARMR